MRRKLFTLAAGASAALCVAVCVLWVHSVEYLDEITWAAWEPAGSIPLARAFRAVACEGRIQVSYETIDRATSLHAKTMKAGMPDGFRSSSTDLAIYRNIGASPAWIAGTGGRDFAFGPSVTQNPVYRTVSYQVQAPGWIIAGTASVLPALWFVSLMRLKLARLRAGKSNLCLQCGYDLRATPERCPEMFSLL